MASVCCCLPASVAVLYAPGYLLGARFGWVHLALLRWRLLFRCPSCGARHCAPGCGCCVSGVGSVSCGASHFARSVWGITLRVRAARRPGSGRYVWIRRHPVEAYWLVCGRIAANFLRCALARHGQPLRVLPLGRFCCPLHAIRSFLDTGFYSMLKANGYATLGGTGDTTRRFGMVLLPLWRHCLGFCGILRRTL